MIPAFDALTNPEIELMFKSPFLACILIAGADGDIDRKEMRSAIEFATKKQKNAPSDILQFYREVGEDFEDKFKIVVQNYPAKAAQRNKMIVEELSKLNTILPKLEKSFAVGFYKSIREIVMGIANSSGGMLGMNKIGNEEARYVTLPMIHDPS
jgi:polyribonucleotide nucleotidyltransferase